MNKQFDAKRQRLLFGTLASIGTILWLLIAPPRWWLNLIKPVDLNDPAKAGSLVVVKYGCRDCHRIEGRGATFAPDLTGVSGRLDAVSIRLWLRDPRAIKGDTPMPNFHLSDGEIEAIVAYLKELDAR